MNPRRHSARSLICQCSERVCRMERAFNHSPSLVKHVNHAGNDSLLGNDFARIPFSSRHTLSRYFGARNDESHFLQSIHCERGECFHTFPRCFHGCSRYLVSSLWSREFSPISFIFRDKTPCILSSSRALARLSDRRENVQKKKSVFLAKPSQFRDHGIILAKNLARRDHYLTQSLLSYTPARSHPALPLCNTPCRACLTDERAWAMWRGYHPYFVIRQWVIGLFPHTETPRS